MESLSEPGPGGTCRVCDTKLPEGSLRCGVCGAVWGEAHRCPHCRAVADVEPGPDAGRCRVCGGPRIRVEDGTTVRSGREIPVLLRARHARRSSNVLALGGIAAATLAGAGLLVTALAVALGFSATLSAAGVIAAALSMAFSALLFRRSKRERRDASRRLQEARLLVASDVMRSHAGLLTVPELARALGTTDADSELLLAELSLNDFLRAHVDPLGEVTVHTRVLTQVAPTVGADELGPAELPPAIAPTSPTLRR